MMERWRKRTQKLMHHIYRDLIKQKESDVGPHGASHSRRRVGCCVEAPSAAEGNDGQSGVPRGVSGD